MPDIAEQLDAAIGIAPGPAPALDRTIAEGRRALGRRRLSVAIGAVATAVVIGGTAWAVSPGDGGSSRSDAPGFGSATSAAPTPAPTSPTPNDLLPELPDWPGQDAVMLDEAGGLLVKPGWTVTEQIDEINGPGTLAVEVVRGERRQWFLFGKAMTISSLHAPSEGYATFDEWVDVNGPLIEGKRGGGQGDNAGGWPGEPRDDLVRFIPRFISSARGLEPVSSDVTVVDQVFNPDLGESFAPSSRTGAAEVRKGDQSWYVVARRPADFIAVATDVAERRYGITDLAGFIAFAQERYAEGGGGLL
ncbi:hypothetical protein F0U44_04655 [Nocardioides humilatus]|uniref:Uncharacterized protein n=1 Tax=Nocardioides humilatus TaxID=2607660 RepID=A0A5B1LPK3_9ACTN|nr:hypothetical protein [Nocardioides humilatus]KAA1421579.1 hypothetical protein F0U44_04655 [Nocardioides humilatus]